MKIYRVRLSSETDYHDGFMFFGDRGAAESAKARHDRVHPDGPVATIDDLSVEPTRAGILAFLNRWASHPDKG